MKKWRQLSVFELWIKFWTNLIIILFNVTFFTHHLFSMSQVSIDTKKCWLIHEYIRLINCSYIKSNMNNIHKEEVFLYVILSLFMLSRVKSKCNSNSALKMWFSTNANSSLFYSISVFCLIDIPFKLVWNRTSWKVSKINKID